LAPASAAACSVLPFTVIGALLLSGVVVGALDA
jgi:hypothetical protein